MESAKVKITEDGQIIISLNSILEKHKFVTDLLKYGKEHLEVDEISFALKMKELKLKSN